MYLGKTHIDDCWLLGAEEGILAFRVGLVVGKKGLGYGSDRLDTM